MHHPKRRLLDPCHRNCNWLDAETVDLAPLTTFPSQDTSAQLSEASASFYSAPSGSLHSLLHWALATGATATMGIGLVQQQGFLSQPGVVLQGPQQVLWRPSALPQQPAFRLPPADQIPPSWAFYPGQGWVEYQWTPAPMLQPVPIYQASPNLGPQLAPVQPPAQVQLQPNNRLQPSSNYQHSSWCQHSSPRKPSNQINSKPIAAASGQPLTEPQGS